MCVLVHDGYYCTQLSWVLIQSSGFLLPCGNMGHHTDTGFPGLFRYHAAFLLFFYLTSNIDTN